MARMPAVKPTPRALALLAVFAGIGFIACVGVYLVGSNALRKATIQLQDCEKRVDENKRIADRLEQAEQRCTAAQSQVSFLERSVNTRDYIPTLLKQLEQLGKSVDLKVVGVRPKIEPQQPAAPKPPQGSEAGGAAKEQPAEKSAAPPAAKERKPYDSLSIDLEVEGSYADLMTFLHGITSFPKILEVNTMQISPASKSSGRGSPDLTIQINVTAYVFHAESGGETIPHVRPVESSPPAGEPGTRVTRRIGAKAQRSSNELG